MQSLAAFAGASLSYCTRLVVYIGAVYKSRPAVNRIERQLWLRGTCPPRTSIEVQRLNADDICEAEVMLWLKGRG